MAVISCFLYLTTVFSKDSVDLLLPPQFPFLQVLLLNFLFCRQIDALVKILEIRFEFLVILNIALQLLILINIFLDQELIGLFHACYLPRSILILINNSCQYFIFGNESKSSLSLTGNYREKRFISASEARRYAGAKVAESRTSPSEYFFSPRRPTTAALTC